MTTPLRLRHLLVALPAAAVLALSVAPSGSAEEPDGETPTACGGTANWFESSQQPEATVTYWSMRVGFTCNKDFAQFRVHVNRKVVAVGGRGFKCKRQGAKTFRCKGTRADDDAVVFPTIRSKTAKPCRGGKVVVTVTAAGQSFTVGGPCGEDAWTGSEDSSIE